MCAIRRTSGGPAWHHPVAMPNGLVSQGRDLAAVIAESGLTIYDSLQSHPELFFDTETLEEYLGHALVGRSYPAPIRTRAKTAKQDVAAALGYPVPTSFRKTRPRFPGQDLDVYVQKANNLQIWNEEIAPLRRYVIIGVNQGDFAFAVRVVDGETLSRLDRTGTLTSKYQAARRAGRTGSALVSLADTDEFRIGLGPVDQIAVGVLNEMSPTSPPERGKVLSIEALYRRLQPLVGRTLLNIGLDQERNRGAGLHAVVCELLDLDGYADFGQFPDVPNQVLEVKLQTAPTVDLGLVVPDSIEPSLGLREGLRHCDTRYLVVFGDRTLDGHEITVTAIVLTTGVDFFSEFRGFGGLVQNRKLQIPLPANFFRGLARD